MTEPGAAPATILIVDDEISSRKLLEVLLRPEGYLTRSAATGEQALASIAERAPDLILLDIMLPGMDGYEVARTLKANPATASIPIIMVTAHTDHSTRLAGLDAGAEDFLTKPVDRTELWLRVRNLLRLKAFDDLLKNHNVILEQRVMERTASLATANETLRADNEQIQRYIEQLKVAFMSSVEVATIISGMRDPYTAGHARRVADVATAIGAELGFDAQRQEGLRVAGLLHDIGKMIIPAEILSKPGKLSAIQFKLVQGHAQAGYDVLKDVEFPWPVAEVTLQHHERIDGSGYPQGLKGEAILLEARILAVADVVEAMSSHRPYRPGLGIEAALAEIEHGSGIIYDATVAAACLKLFRQQGFTIPA